MSCNNGNEFDEQPARVRFFTDSPDASLHLERLPQKACADFASVAGPDPSWAASAAADLFEIDWLDKLVVDLIPEYAWLDRTSPAQQRCVPRS